MSRTSLTLQDDGRTVQTTPGDEIVVSLDENPTTGFRWAIDELDSALVEVSDETTVGGSAGPGGLVGAAREVRKTFQVLAPGCSALRLKEWRSWEGDGSVRRRFTVTIEASD